MRTKRSSADGVRTERAFTLAETVISTLLVGGLLVVALNTVGDATLGRQKIGDRGRAQLLAQDLMAEILGQAYKEPVDPPTFGREPSESGGARVDYDDVDDYHGWDSSPPEYKDGTAMTGLTGWRRTVTVEYVDPNDLTHTVAGDQGIKRITLTVSRNDLVLGSLTAVRTAATDQSQPSD